MNITENCISTKGIVVKIKKNIVVVEVTSTSACASCHAKGACSSTDLKNKIIEVYTSESNTYSIGDRVKVTINENLGLKAVIIGYVAPILLLIITLFTTFNYLKEIYSALLSVLVIAFYYFFLYLFRNKINKKFKFSISHI